MSLRIRVELNKGRRGIPIRKLSAITHETLKFLGMLCEDLGAEDVAKDWLATNFENNSVDFDCEMPAGLNEDQAELGRAALRFIMGHAAFDPSVAVRIRSSTRLQYSALANHIDPDEVIRFGLYSNGENKPKEWFELDKSTAETITEETPPTAQYYGEIQGIIHSLLKESDHPKLVVRELSTRALIDCFFAIDLYEVAVDTLHEREGVVFVEGIVTENRARGIVESIEVKGFRKAPEFNPNDIEAFVGKYPNATGGLKTEIYIKKFRGNA